jgi:Xaa-Pro aminopeptidase
MTTAGRAMVLLRGTWQPGCMDAIDENERVRNLIAAEEKAEILFAEVKDRGLIAPGERESVVSNRVRDLGAELFGTDKHWHKRVVRSGPNTLKPYRENPPDRTITEDDIVFLDFGPIFARWEADFGRTYVLGADPVKLRLQADLPRIFAAGRAHFDAHPEITGAELYAHVVGLAEAAGWEFGGPHSGHLVGEFPHELVDGERIESYIAPANGNVMRGTDRVGRLCHWILEVHLVDRDRQIGGFFEQLLTLRGAGVPA